MRISNAIKLIKKIDEYYADKIKAGEKMPCGKFGMRIRAIWSFIVYGTSFSEYFGYSFYNKKHKEKLTYMTRRHMFKFLDKYNPIEYRNRMGDKSQAAKYYGKFMNREQFMCEQGFEAFEKFCGKYPRIFIKKAVGWGGEGARIEDVSTEEKLNAVWGTLSEEWVVEPVIENCEELKKLHPASLNTLRIITLIVQGKPEIEYASLRIGNGHQVDNMHIEGISGGIGLETGRINTSIVDRHFMTHEIHPLTGEKLTEISIPFWEEVKKTVIDAAMVTPQIRYASWDVAVTPNGPVIIEGNWDAEFYNEQVIFNQGNRTKYIELLERA